MNALWRFSGAVVLAAFAAGAVAGEPSFSQVRGAYRGSATVLLDRHGQPVQWVRTDLHAVRGAWVPLAQVSPALRAATIVAEDRRFESHAGVDWAAVAGAAIGRAQEGGTRGASTITMQLVGLVDAELALPRGGRSIMAKIGQAAAALQLERRWSKEQILEAYLNLVPFRGELVGVDAMAHGLFGKMPSGLDAEESAMAASLLRAPNASAGVVAERACQVLRVQGRGEECVAVRGVAEAVLARPPAPAFDAEAQLAPHFARLVMAPYGPASSGLAGMDAATPGATFVVSSKPPRAGEVVATTPPSRAADLARVAPDSQRADAAPTGARPTGSAVVRPAAPAVIRTTLDAATQARARDALREQLSELRGRNVEDGAVVVLDNASGDVIAWVGSSGSLSQAPAVDAVLARRQPGSTLKPFLYEQAIEERWLTAASILEDTPARLETSSGLYIPQDYDHDFKGPVSVRTALGSSLNVPAVRALVLVSPERFARRLVALGLPIAKPGGFYGYSLALGSAEVNLLSLTNAYRALANGGMGGAPRWVMAASPAVPVREMDAGATFIVADILADNGARVRTFGLDNALATRYASSVKTGTSKDMRDNWCVGFDARFTVGVWVGNASGLPMHAVSGVTGAAPVWRRVMDALQGSAMSLSVATKHAVGDARVPVGLMHARVDFDGALEPPRDEWFLDGTQMGRVTLATAAGRAARLIVSPDDGSVIALDPDIPPAAQRLRFEAVSPVPAGSAWRLDGKRLGAARALPWAPWPGSHRLELLDGQGRVIDTVNFSVRGATVLAARGGAGSGH